MRYDEKLNTEFSDGRQIIQIKAFSEYKFLGPIFNEMGGTLQAVSLECAASKRKTMGEWLASFGANRICRAGNLQHPPITWHHDGRLNLASWLYWTDLEK